jgi:hypothetical protein
MLIDVDKLEADLKKEYMGAFFGGGYGAAIVEMSSLNSAPPEKIVETAIKMRLDLRKYQVD